MSEAPDHLMYTKDHEWAKLEGTHARVGITDHAQHELTDVVYVELPAIGKVVKRGEEIGVVESVKAASEVYAPMGGRVVEVNKALEDNPELGNKQPYGDGWIVVLEVVDPNERDVLLNAASYRKHIGE